MTAQGIDNLMDLLEPFLADPDIVEIMVDGYDRVYVERHGQFEDVQSPFRDNDHLLAVIMDAYAALGRPVGPEKPMEDVRLSDGPRMNTVLPPIALTGPTLVIRKFSNKSLTADQLVEFGSWNQDIMTFLQACVKGRLNIAVSGGTGSGKTTVLNVIAGMIPPDERVIVVENATELRLPHKRLIRLESRPADFEGRGEVTIRDLVTNVMRMRPDRVVLGEVRAGEAMEIIQAMSTGHDGSMLSIHATSIQDVLHRLEMLILMAGLDLPLVTIRQRIVSSLQLITYLELMTDGKRRMLKIAEVVGMAGQSIETRDIFEFHQTGMDGDYIVGEYRPTGYVPTFYARMKAEGSDLPESIFQPK
ncbi:CpaF family protein [Chloroflexota bacterium]